MDYWAGYIVAAWNIERDRAAEFRAAGLVSDEELAQHRGQMEVTRDVLLAKLVSPR